MNNNSTKKRRILILLYICMSSIKINNPIWCNEPRIYKVAVHFSLFQEGAL